MLRLNFLNEIYYQWPKIVHLNCVPDQETEFLYKEQTQKSILDFVLSAGWKEWEKSTPTMNDLEGIFLS